jgi:hypothetical protein
MEMAYRVIPQVQVTEYSSLPIYRKRFDYPANKTRRYESAGERTCSCAAGRPCVRREGRFLEAGET